MSPLELFNFWAPWVISFLTILTMIMAGNKHKDTWVVALVGQFWWLAWIITSQSWGLLPSNLVLWVVYYRNLIKWDKEQTDAGT